MCFCVLLYFTACMLYYCNTVGWAWWDWRLIWWLTIVLQCFDTVGWVTWPVKISSPNDLYCVEWDVKPYSTQCWLHLITRRFTRLAVQIFNVFRACNRQLSASQEKLSSVTAQLESKVIENTAGGDTRTSENGPSDVSLLKVCVCTSVI